MCQTFQKKLKEYELFLDLTVIRFLFAGHKSQKP